MSINQGSAMFYKFKSSKGIENHLAKKGVTKATISIEGVEHPLCDEEISFSIEVVSQCDNDDLTSFDMLSVELEDALREIKQLKRQLQIKEKGGNRYYAMTKDESLDHVPPFTLDEISKLHQE
jgi:hypothetical protein